MKTAAIAPSYAEPLASIAIDLSGLDPYLGPDNYLALSLPAFRINAPVITLEARESMQAIGLTEAEIVPILDAMEAEFFKRVVTAQLAKLLAERMR